MTTLQAAPLAVVAKKVIPELDISSLSDSREVGLKYADLIKKSGVESFAPKVEVWTSEASNKSLSYLSHGIFRYFGKFPPPIARHLIKTYTKERDLIIDPMCGSGTSALEALILGRKALCFDVNPLSVLISEVKITSIDTNDYLKSLEKIVKKCESTRSRFKKVNLVGLRNPDHWFLPRTIESLSKIKSAIDESQGSEETKKALLVAFLAIVRRVSRATTQQGRLFLDVETAEEDALPFFQKKALDLMGQLSAIPPNINVRVKQASILDVPNTTSQVSSLIICHPPYFNSYKYSGVNSLELAWFGIDHSDIRKREVRESFKVGKPEKVEEYLQDMEAGLRNLANYLSINGRIALMIGDTVIKGEYIPVTQKLLKRLKNVYSVEKTALRIPKFTEASWAASQRRNGQEIGVNLCDLMVILKKHES